MNRHTNNVGTSSALAALVMAITLLLSGCSTTEPPENAETTSVVIVAGNTMGSAPADASLFADVIRDAVTSGGAIDILVADGSPQSALGGAQSEVGSTARNAQRRSQENAAIVNMVVSTVRNARPEDEEADVFAAIVLAKRELSSAPEGRRIVVVCASGLSTVGLLDFTREGMLLADPKELASYYQDKGELPDLSGVEVMLMGIGDTREPQSPLTMSCARNLQEIYRTLLETCGATVSVSDAVSSVSIDNELPHVTEVSVPAQSAFDAAELPAKLELTEAEVKFVPDTADYVHPEETKTFLASIASALVEHPEAKVRVVGSTASLPSDHAWTKQLSKMRADAVASTLAEYGVSAGRITTVGIGDEEGEGVSRVDDLDATGTQVPENASLNRKVTLFIQE